MYLCLHYFILFAKLFFLKKNLSIFQVLKFTPSQKAQFRQEALALFQSRFGFTDPESEPTRLRVGLFQVNEAADLRAVVLSGERHVPRKGFRVLDGGLMITVIDPAGERYSKKSLFLMKLFDSD